MQDYPQSTSAGFGKYQIFSESAMEEQGDSPGPERRYMKPARDTSSVWLKCYCGVRSRVLLVETSLPVDEIRQIVEEAFYGQAGSPTHGTRKRLVLDYLDAMGQRVRLDREELWRDAIATFFHQRRHYIYIFCDTVEVVHTSNQHSRHPASSKVLSPSSSSSGTSPGSVRRSTVSPTQQKSTASPGPSRRIERKEEQEEEYEEQEEPPVDDKIYISDSRKAKHLMEKARPIGPKFQRPVENAWDNPKLAENNDRIARFQQELAKRNQLHELLLKQGGRGKPNPREWTDSLDSVSSESPVVGARPPSVLSRVDSHRTPDDFSMKLINKKSEFQRGYSAKFQSARKQQDGDRGSNASSRSSSAGSYHGGVDRQGGYSPATNRISAGEQDYMYGGPSAEAPPTAYAPAPFDMGISYMQPMLPYVSVPLLLPSPAGYPMASMSFPTLPLADTYATAPMMYPQVDQGSYSAKTSARTLPPLFTTPGGRGAYVAAGTIQELSSAYTEEEAMDDMEEEEPTSEEEILEEESNGMDVEDEQQEQEQEQQLEETASSYSVQNGSGNSYATAPRSSAPLSNPSNLNGASSKKGSGAVKFLLASRSATSSGRSIDVIPEEEESSAGASRKEATKRAPFVPLPQYQSS